MLVTPLYPFGSFSLPSLPVHNQDSVEFNELLLGYCQGIHNPVYSRALSPRVIVDNSFTHRVDPAPSAHPQEEFLSKA